VLGLPPAFVLSQDQTLKFVSIKSLKIEFWFFEVMRHHNNDADFFKDRCFNLNLLLTSLDEAKEMNRMYHIDH